MCSERVDRFEDRKAQKKSRKIYATPKLTVHGGVEHITQQIGDTGSDLFVGSVVG